MTTKERIAEILRPYVWDKIVEAVAQEFVDAGVVFKDEIKTIDLRYTCGKCLEEVESTIYLDAGQAPTEVKEEGR